MGFGVCQCCLIAKHSSFPEETLYLSSSPVSAPLVTASLASMRTSADCLLVLSSAHGQCFYGSSDVSE